MHILGSSTAIWRISLRFFSPPEKPMLTGRLSMSASIWRVFAFSRMSLRKSAALISSSPRATRCALRAVRRKVMLPTPGNLDGVLEGEKEAGGGPFLGLHRENVLAFQRRTAVGDHVAAAPRKDVGEGRLARPVRPHHGVDRAPRVDGEVDALEDFLVLFLEFHFQVSDLKHDSLLWPARPWAHRSCCRNGETRRTRHGAAR